MLNRCLIEQKGSSVNSYLPARVVRGRLDLAAAVLPLGEGHLAEHSLQLARRHRADSHREYFL